ncbi:MAG: hypothetical protein ACJ8AO_03455 [Gemmatimonadaceae bacterium]
MATRERSTKRSRRETAGAERAAEGAERRKGGERTHAPGSSASHVALYRAEKARRQALLPTTQALEEARREFEQMLKESRPAGTGGRPRKKPAAPAGADIELDELDEGGEADAVVPEVEAEADE